jgi:hypothetical protein
MNTTRFQVFRRLTQAMLIGLVAAHAVATLAAEPAMALTSTVRELDTRVFDAYNKCDMPAFARYFSPTVEFYHDDGGATFDRKTVVANTRKFICGKVRRELLPETFKVYPIKDYGAVEEGEHRFCEIQNGKCEGIARFLMIWKQVKDRWVLTRVVSYGHRAMTDAEKTVAQGHSSP